MITLVTAVGIPESFARPQYLTNLSAVYGDGSCGTCRIRASCGGPRNSYGTLFEDQPNHATDPGAALAAIGPPPTATPALTPTVTPTPAASGFGIVVTLVGLFTWALLIRRHNK